MRKKLFIAAAIIALILLAYFKSQGSIEAVQVDIASAETQEIKS